MLLPFPFLDYCLTTVRMVGKMPIMSLSLLPPLLWSFELLCVVSSHLYEYATHWNLFLAPVHIHLLSNLMLFDRPDPTSPVTC